MNDGYIEQGTQARLDALGAAQLLPFAAACAEVVLPLFGDYAATGPDGAMDLLRGTLDDLWSGGVDGDVDVDALGDRIEALVPDDDAPGWTPWHGFAQNAADAVAYGLRVSASGEAQDAAWVARQLREVGDYLDRLVAPHGTDGRPGPNETLAMESIELFLSQLEAGVADLRNEASRRSVLLRDRAAAVLAG